MFKPEEAWKIIKRNAEKAKIAKAVWQSTKDYHRYSVLNVTEKSISILKIETGKGDLLKLRQVQKAYEEFEKKGRKIRRGNLIKKSVVKETALVLFHPQLTWSKNKRYIMIDDN